MSERPWRGSFAIPMTPYNDADRIDEKGLAGAIDFCIAGNVGGIMTPLMGSEFRSLAGDRRKIMKRTPV